MSDDYGSNDNGSNQNDSVDNYQAMPDQDQPTAIVISIAPPSDDMTGLMPPTDNSPPLPDVPPATPLPSEPIVREPSPYVPPSSPEPSYPPPDYPSQPAPVPELPPDGGSDAQRRALWAAYGPEQTAAPETAAPVSDYDYDWEGRRLGGRVWDPRQGRYV